MGVNLVFPRKLLKRTRCILKFFYTAGIHFTWPLVATVMTNLNSECLVLFCFCFSACSAKYSLPNVLFSGKKKDQSLSQQREFIGVTGNKIAEDKKSTRQLVYVPQQGSLYCSTTRQIADFLNKALSAHKSDYFPHAYIL